MSALSRRYHSRRFIVVVVDYLRYRYVHISMLIIVVVLPEAVSVS